jgi:hypothetical protein
LLLFIFSQRIFAYSAVNAFFIAGGHRASINMGFLIMKVKGLYDEEFNAVIMQGGQEPDKHNYKMLSGVY